MSYGYHNCMNAIINTFLCVESHVSIDNRLKYNNRQCLLDDAFDIIKKFTISFKFLVEQKKEDPQHLFFIFAKSSFCVLGEYIEQQSEDIAMRTSIKSCYQYLDIDFVCILFINSLFYKLFELLNQYIDDKYFTFCLYKKAKPTLKLVIGFINKCLNICHDNEKVIKYISENIIEYMEKAQKNPNNYINNALILLNNEQEYNDVELLKLHKCIEQCCKSLEYIEKTIMNGFSYFIDISTKNKHKLYFVSQLIVDLYYNPIEQVTNDNPYYKSKKDSKFSHMIYPVSREFCKSLKYLQKNNQIKTINN